MASGVQRLHRFRDDLRAPKFLKPLVDEVNAHSRVFNNLRCHGLRGIVRADSIDLLAIGGAGAAVLNQQFWPRAISSTTVRVHGGYISIGRAGRFAISQTDVVVGASGWILVRTTVANPGTAPAVVYSPTGPQPTNTTYYEWTICQVTKTTDALTVDNISAGEKEIFVTL